jgi:putative ABC transport system permease protein
MGLKATSLRWIDELFQDLRYATRRFSRDRTFSLTVLTTLALGIGAATGVFSVVTSVVFRPLPFNQPDRLVQMYGTPASRGEAVDDLADYRSQSTSFDAMVGYGVSARYLFGSGGSELVKTVAAEREFFPMLGVAPSIGRWFGSDDPATVAVVAEHFWRRRFEGDPSAVGATLTLDDTPFTIVGVMPESFQFPYGAGSLLAGARSQMRTDLWVPLDAPRDGALRTRSRFSQVTGRLKPNVDIRAAEQELSLIAQRREARSPDRYGPRGVRLERLSDVVVGSSVRQALFLLLAAVGLVFLLTCANLTNLGLVRLMLRSREIAIRLAVGATSGRIVRQWLAEGVLLSLAGGGVAWLLATWTTKWLVFLAGPYLPRADEVHMDWRVFLFLLAACMATAAALSAAPAVGVLWNNSRPGRHQLSHPRSRHALVVLEMALAFVLAVGATALIRELNRLRATNIGITTGNVLTVHVGQRMISRGRDRPLPGDVAAFYDIASRVEQLADVRAAGFIQALPLQNWGWRANSLDFQVRGRSPSESPVTQFELRYVTPGYFRALGIPLLAGRWFTAQDDRDRAGVILINNALAKQYFAGEDPIGRETTRGRIVGIVGDVRQVDIDQPAVPELYYPIAQNWSQVAELGMTLVVSSRAQPERLIDPVRSVIHDVNPNLVVFSVKPMDNVVADWLAGLTLFLWLIAAFSALALVLAGTGTYGIMSSVIASHTREVGIRIALGGDRWRVMRWVWGEGVRLAALGLGIGVAVIVIARPVLRGLAQPVPLPDLAAVLPAAVALFVVAIAACHAPARRAAAVDPAITLREE